MANDPKLKTTKKEETTKGASGLFATFVIPACLVIGILLYKFVFGNPMNFEGGTPDGHPLPGNYLGMAYKGGVIVPILVSMFLMVIVFSVERFIVVNKATGASSVDKFVTKIQQFLSTGNIDAALAECDKQKGSVANVIRSGLKKYKEAESDANLDTEHSCLAIQKDIEEATALEMPMLQQNLTIIATLVSIGTLMGLLGTVTGMIKAFAALATTGNPDPGALAAGISEALINTAIGIGTSAISIIMYNMFTGMIDKLTYGIDEIGYSIAQTFASTRK